jgi:hypothetical protein
MGASDGQMSKCYTATKEKLAKLSLEDLRYDLARS